MEIVFKPLSELKNYEKNARTHDDVQILELVDSIKNFGFLDPIEIDDKAVIISGHARATAAAKAGLLEVPTITHNLGKSAKKAYILAANRLALKAGWDGNFLREELKELRDDEFDLKLTGFTHDEIEDYLNPEILNDGLINEDNCGDLSTSTPITKRNDVWTLGNHRLMCGDSTLADDVGLLLNGQIPILMVTDPPYGVNYDPEWRDEADLGVGKRSRGKVKNDDIVDWTGAYSLFPGDAVYVWHAGKYTGEVSEHLRNCGFDIVSQIIWVKQHFALSRGDYHWQHEPCWYAVRSGKPHNWQGARDQATTWSISNNNSFGNSNREETWGHGTQKPVECMSRPIVNNSKAHQLIYDPFGGSGTTLIACEKFGRRCAMMELDEKYCDVVIKRWEKFTGKKAVLESTGELFDDSAQRQSGETGS